jgi:UDP-glucuronate 4-epimerase
MAVLVTGAAGFIGFHTCQALLAQGQEVIGLDNLNAYYDVSLKQARLDNLLSHPGFRFEKQDLVDRDAILGLAKNYPSIDNIVHLAAQAGVRYSIENPFAYADANITGYLNILELARRLSGLKHLVYASSSSVYGANQKLPFSVHDPVDKPMSLYAATKRANELMGHTYAHLYQIPLTGLRFFTVYGPWGRPDMSAFIFTRAILNDDPIPVFNHGDMRRNFTYIDDIIQGVMRCLASPPATDVKHRVYNIGNNESVALMDFIGHLEQHLGKQAKIDFKPMQPGDVKETIADISDTQRDFGFTPTTQVEAGLGYFTEWYRAYYGQFAS